jgi:hypothetical protein
VFRRALFRRRVQTIITVCVTALEAQVITKKFIIQNNVYKYRLLINTQTNTLVQYRINRINDEFVQWKIKHLLLLWLEARDIFLRETTPCLFAQPHACPGFQTAQTIPTDQNAYMGSKKVTIHGCLSGPGNGLPPSVAVWLHCLLLLP